MSRTIQVGDLALITVGDQQFSFPITSIDSSGIYLPNYNIVSVNNQWQVQGYHVPHTVTFYEAPSRVSFTGVRELDWNILLELDYQSLARACQANIEINRICQDDSFWKAKVRHEFGVDQYKPEGISYRQQYQDLITVEDTDVDISTENGRVDLLITLEKRGILPTQDGANWAAWKGRFQVLEWLATRNILPTQEGANLAAGNGRLQVLEWLRARNILPTQRGADLAAMKGHLPVLELLATRNILPTQVEANYAAMNGRLPVLEWLAARNILPTQQGANLAAENGQLQVLEWFEARNILPTQQGADWAARNEYQEVVEWLAAHGIYPTR